MIDRILVRKYVGQSMLLWLACGTALFAFAWVRVWVVTLLDMGQFHTVLNQLKAFEKFAPIEFSALLTYSGRVGMAFDEPIVILCTVIWCVARGSDVVSGELNRGTLEMLLAQPISRTKLLFSHALVSVTGLGLLCMLVWGGISIGVHTLTLEETLPPPTWRIPILNFDLPMQSGEPETQELALSDRVSAATYASSTFHLFAFGFFLLALSSFFSSFDRYRWRTIGAVMTVYVVQLVMFGLGKAAESLDWLRGYSFFTCYKPQQMTSLVGDGDLAAPWSMSTVLPGSSLPPLFYPLILIGLGVLLYGVAAWRFQTRDLPAPL